MLINAFQDLQVNDPVMNHEASRCGCMIYRLFAGWLLSIERAHAKETSRGGNRYKINHLKNGASGADTWECGKQ